MCDLVEDSLHDGASLFPSASSQILSDPVNFHSKDGHKPQPVLKHQKSSSLARTQFAPRCCPRWGNLLWLSQVPQTVLLWAGSDGFLPCSFLATRLSDDEKAAGP